MLTLYSYPELYGVADNNGYGLKVFAFLKLAGVPFRHEHIFDASAGPRGQLPYIVDDGEVLGDSETIIAHLLHKYRLPIDDQLTNAQRHIHSLVIRMLDDLYWVMSYSRWKDEQFWPAFRDLLIREHPQLNNESLQQAREFNDKRYLLSRDRALCARGCLCTRDHRFADSSRPNSDEWLRVRNKADQYRRRHLWIHRQYLFLAYRNTAQAIR